MGYTHHFEQKQAISQDDWQKIESDFRCLLAQMPEHSTTAGACYASEPLTLDAATDQALTVNEEMIFFNGDGEELSHESFVLYRDGSEYLADYEREAGRKFPYSFCKTARKPYDLMVCAVLILTAKHAPDAYRIGSDGTPDDWQPALEFVESVLGSGYSIPPRVLALEGYTEEFKREYRREHSALVGIG